MNTECEVESPGRQLTVGERRKELHAKLAKAKDLPLDEYKSIVRELELLDKKPPKTERKALLPSKQAKAAENVKQACYRYVSEIVEKDVEWLWPDCILGSAFNLLAGTADLGKGHVVYAMASVITTGGVWPVSNTPCEPGAVIFLSSEENAEFSLRPRLKAAGANLELCMVLEGIKYTDANGALHEDDFRLGADLLALETLINAMRTDRNVRVRMIVIDPLISYMGGIKIYDTSAVREALAPLKRFAERHKLAILGVMHFNKSNTQDSGQRINASLSFREVARAVWHVYPDETNPDRRMLLPDKNNYGGENKWLGYGFAFKSVVLDSGVKTSKIEWEGTHETRRANDVMRANQRANQEDQGGKLREAQQFLTGLLSKGPVKADDVEIAYRKEGFTTATIRRAKKQLKIESVKEGKDDWVWVLKSADWKVLIPLSCDDEHLPKSSNHAGLGGIKFEGAHCIDNEHLQKNEVQNDDKIPINEL